MQTHIQVLSEDEKAQVHERTLKVLRQVERHFLEDEMGLPCQFAIARKDAQKLADDFDGQAPAVG